MCYLVRHQQPEPKHEGAPGAPGLEHLRPRWVAAGAAALVAGLAVAASFVTTPAMAPTPIVKEHALAAPILPVKDAAVPAAAGGEQRSLPVDDGVPSDDMKASAGGCHHGV